MVDEGFVDVGEGFEVAFGVCGRGAAGGFGGVTEIAVGGAVDLHRVVGPFQQHGVRFFLVPFEAAFFAINADVQVVLFADADLRGVQDAFGAVVETEEDVDVVVKFATGHEGGGVSGEFFDLQTGDVFGQIFRMRADVADAAARAALLGVGAPESLFLAVDL